MKKNKFFMLFFLLCILQITKITAQEASSHISISSFALNGPDNYLVVENTYAIVGTSALISLEISPRIVDNSEVVEEEFESYSLIRAYNGTSQTLPTDDLRLSDEVKLVSGLDQTIFYHAEFQFRKRTRNIVSDDGNGTIEYSDWSDWNSTTEVVDITTDRFSIYEEPISPKMDVPNLCTFVNGPKRDFKEDINKSSGNPNGWTVMWFIGEDEEVGESFTFIPDDSYIGETKLTVRIINYAPDNATIWFDESTSFDITTYRDVSEIIAEYVYPQGAECYTYLDRKDKENICRYQFILKDKDGRNIDDIGLYGNLICEWKRNSQVVSDLINETDASFIPTLSGTSNTSLSLRLTNPTDESEVWRIFDVPEFPAFTVFEKPIPPTFNVPERMTTYVGRSIGNFEMQTNSSTGNPNGWTYTWNDKSGSVFSVDVTKENFNPGIKVSAYYKNANPADPNEIWLEGTSDEYLVRVFPAPEDPTFKLPSNYVITTDSTTVFEAVANGGNPTNWSYEWRTSSSGDNIMSSTNKYIYSPQNDAGLSVEITCKITNISPDGDIWYEKEFSMPHKLDVYETPLMVDKDYHQNADSDKWKYDMFMGQELDFSQLFETSGGITDGWVSDVKINGSSLNTQVFQPNAPGTYNINCQIINTATLTTGERKRWLDENREYEVTVYPTPEVFSNFSEYGDVHEYHMLSDETIYLNLKYDGGNSDSWNMDWNINPDGAIVEKTHSQNIYQLSFTGVNESSIQSKDYIVKYSVSNAPRNIIKDGAFFSSEEMKICVWKELIAVVDDLKERESDGFYVIETYEGKDGEELSVHPLGGLSLNWSYEWVNENGSPAGSPSGAKYSLKNLKADGNNPAEYHYHVTAAFNNGNAHFENTNNIAVIVWPRPSVDDISVRLNEKPSTNTKEILYEMNGKRVSADCYSGDELKFLYTIKGGNISSHGMWSINVDNKEMVIDNESDGLSSTGILDLTPSSTNSSIDYKMWTIQFNCTYTGEYYSSSKIWYSDTYYVSSNIYPQPAISSELSDSSAVNGRWGEDRIQVYEGNSINMKFNRTANGNPNGWKYEWQLDGITQSTALDEWVYVPTSDKPYEDKTLSVHLTNEINGNYGLNQTLTYPIRVWKRVVNNNGFLLSDITNPSNQMKGDVLNTREGNVVQIHSNPIQYGYNPAESVNYTYRWEGITADNLATEFEFKAENDVNDNKFGFSSKQYSLVVQNIGPYGHVWYNSPRIIKTLNVYNHPQTPTSIVKKGNGNSGTMICTTTISDQLLDDQHYYLVFGYRDSNGEDHDYASQEQVAPGEVRWSKQFGNENQMSNAYVYALWKADGVEITSGKCSLNSVDQDWDGSTYDGSTRAIINEEYNTIFDIAEETSNTKVVKVFSLDGKLLSQSVKDLKPGIYIIRFGQNQTRKIIIK